MDNIKLITLLSDYAIFCLERQRNVLAAYRKIRRERWDFIGIILGIIVCAAAIMANTALATAGNLPLMASAFRQAIEDGRKAYLSGLGRVLTRGASASDPLTGFLRD